MKRREELTDQEKANLVQGINYLLSDQWWIDEWADHSDYWAEQLRANGVDPDALNQQELIPRWMLCLLMRSKLMTYLIDFSDPIPPTLPLCGAL